MRSSKANCRSPDAGSTLLRRQRFDEGAVVVAPAQAGEVVVRVEVGAVVRVLEEARLVGAPEQNDGPAGVAVGVYRAFQQWPVGVTGGGGRRQGQDTGQVVERRAVRRR